MIENNSFVIYKNQLALVIEVSDKFTVKIDSIYGFPPLQRWANVTRIREVDISRVDFTCRIGNVNSKVMSDIVNKMHSCGIL